MPLGDHIWRTVSKRSSSQGFHRGWPCMIVQELGNQVFPHALWRSHACIWAAISKSTFAHLSSATKQRLQRAEPLIRREVPILLYCPHWPARDSET